MKKTLLMAGALVALGASGIASGQTTAAAASTAVRNLYLAATDGYVWLPEDGHGDGNPRRVWIRGFVADVAPGACAKTTETYPVPMNLDTSPNPAAICSGTGAKRGTATLPAPIIDVNVGDDVFVTLSNIGNKENVAPDPHTIHLHGLNVSAQNDGLNEFTWSVPIGYMATYYFKAPHAGTYKYHCHVEASEHVQMGMYGALIIRPQPGFVVINGTRYNTQTQTVYGGLWNDYFDNGPDGKPQEYIQLLTEIDPVWHDGVMKNFVNDPSRALNPNASYNGGACKGAFELPNNQGGTSRCIDLATFNPSDFLARYWLVNGRVFPDTILPVASPAGTNQVGQSGDARPADAGPPSGYLQGSNNLTTYRTLMNIKMNSKGAVPGSGPRMMVRIIPIGFTAMSQHFHGFHFTQVGEDGSPVPLLSQHPVFTIEPVSGKTYEVIVAPDCLAGVGQYSTWSHTPGKNLAGQVGGSQWPGVDAFQAAGVFPTDNQLSVQVWPVHSHYDYTVTNAGVYPGGALQAMIASNATCK
jgi:manganese oxidase